MLSSVRLLSLLKLPILVVLLPASLLLVDVFIEWLCKKCWYLHILFWPFTNPLYLSFLSPEISCSSPTLLLSIHQSMPFFSPVKWYRLVSFRNVPRGGVFLYFKSHISQEDTEFPSWQSFIFFLFHNVVLFFEGGDKIDDGWKHLKTMKDCLLRKLPFLRPSG